MIQKNPNVGQGVYNWIEKNDYTYEYYDEHFEELMLKKIDNNEWLFKSELKRLVSYQIERIVKNKYMWYLEICLIIKLKDRFFELNWISGFGEFIEDTFEHQPFEVEQKVRIETKKVKYWDKK